MSQPIGGLVADLGNSRLKLGRFDDAGRLVASRAVGLCDPEEWASALEALDPGGRAPRVAVATVNPPAAERFESGLASRYGAGGIEVIRFRSAAEVPVAHALATPETTGADRALAVLAATGLLAPGHPAMVVACGTATTVERIGADGVWQGGAIGPGAGLIARALNLGTAQLPLVEPPSDPMEAPPPCWGAATGPAVAAGIYWGAVGVARELVEAQRAGLGGAAVPAVWTGGAARMLAARVDGPVARVVPDLVLLGLIAAVLGRSGPAA
jgi:type III pantothenate kinase